MHTSPRPLVILDTETTGLDARSHEPWEVAGYRIERIDGGFDLAEFSFFVEVDLNEADPVALDIGRFHERHPWALGLDEPGDLDDARGSRSLVLTRDEAALTVSGYLDGAILVGCVPSFDERMLTRLLYRSGLAPNWHYQPVDVETLAAGFLLGRTVLGDVDAAVRLPWSSTDLSLAVGVDPAEFDRHTALGDVSWAWAQLLAVTDDGRLLDAVLPDTPATEAGRDTRVEP